MNIIEYYVAHAIPTGWQTIEGAFVAWRDLLTGNWAHYAVLGDDDPYEECRDWFWQLLGEDNVYPKAFVEDLQEIVKRIESGEEVLVTVDFDRADKLDQLLEGLAKEED